MSRDDDSSIEGALGAVSAAVAWFSNGEFGRHLLVDVDAQAGTSAAVEVALADFGGSRQHLVDLWRGRVSFLQSQRTSGSGRVGGGGRLCAVVLVALPCG